MDSDQNFPPEPLDYKRAEFESGVQRIAVEKFGYSQATATAHFLLERNNNGRYSVEWVRGAWEGYNLACLAQPL